MKRAEVGRVRDGDPNGEWYWDVFAEPVPDRFRNAPLSERDYPFWATEGGREHTHVAALAHALAEVGLTEKEQNR